MATGAIPRIDVVTWWRMLHARFSVPGCVLTLAVLLGGATPGQSHGQTGPLPRSNVESIYLETLSSEVTFTAEELRRGGTTEGTLQQVTVEIGAVGNESKVLSMRSRNHLRRRVGTMRAEVVDFRILRRKDHDSGRGRGFVRPAPEVRLLVDAETPFKLTAARQDLLLVRAAETRIRLTVRYVVELQDAYVPPTREALEIVYEIESRQD